MKRKKQTARWQKCGDWVTFLTRTYLKVRSIQSATASVLELTWEYPVEGSNSSKNFHPKLGRRLNYNISNKIKIAEKQLKKKFISETHRFWCKLKVR